MHIEHESTHNKHVHNYKPLIVDDQLQTFTIVPRVHNTCVKMS